MAAEYVWQNVQQQHSQLKSESALWSSSLLGWQPIVTRAPAHHFRLFHFFIPPKNIINYQYYQYQYFVKCQYIEIYQLSVQVFHGILDIDYIFGKRSDTYP